MATEITRTHVPELELMITTVNGEFTVSDDTEEVFENINEVIKHKCKRFLLDARNCDISIKIVSAFDRSRVFSSHNAPRTIRIAGVFSEMNRDIRFLETALRNRGWILRVFTSYDEAMDWLEK